MTTDPLLEASDEANSWQGDVEIFGGDVEMDSEPVRLCTPHWILRTRCRVVVRIHLLLMKRIRLLRCLEVRGSVLRQLPMLVRRYQIRQLPQNRLYLERVQIQ